jgi:hypothetical protein
MMGDRIRQHIALYLGECRHHFVRRHSVVGGFSGTRPILAGVVFFHDLQVTGQVVFLVDTGADASFLGPGDCVRLGLAKAIDQGSRGIRRAPTPVIGIGGSMTPYLARVSLFFAAVDHITGDRIDPYCSTGKIDIVPPSTMASPDPSRWPMSCLGWDVLRGMGRLDFRLPDGKAYFCLPGEGPPRAAT